MIEQAITIADNKIVIQAQFFIHKDYSITSKDVLLDTLGKHYAGQQIIVYFHDGENTEFSGFSNYIKLLCDMLTIPYSRVTFQTHNQTLKNEFKIDPLKLGIFISVNQYLPKDINKDLTGARFVGTLLGRFNITRLRLAYELDRAFPNDSFITFQSQPSFVEEVLKHFSAHYQEEIDWIKRKQFDRDLNSHHYMGMIDWQDACRNYGNVWNRYHIEVISETDAMDNFWFTEKTANCLATGKPFVLISGQHSLARLRSMGFQTFDTVLDESYDTAGHPYERVQRLTNSLQELYNSESKAEKLQELYHLAQKNRELYTEYANR